MKAQLPFLLCLAALAPIGILRAAAEDTIRVDVAADLTDEGEGITRPTPDKPVYYLQKTIGYTTSSGTVLTGETSPPTPYVQFLLGKALRSQGYLYARSKKPSILFLFEWGYKAPVMSEDGKEFPNEAEMETLVFGTKKPSDNRFSLHTDEVYAAAKVSRYYVTVTALDFDAMMKKKLVTLWTARISTELGEGHRLAAVLPTLIDTGAPFLGTQTDEGKFLQVPLLPSPAAPVAAPARKQ
jgi:hypothetical protein